MYISTYSNKAFDTTKYVTLRSKSIREEFKKKANYPHFVDKRFTPPPLSTSAEVNNIHTKDFHQLGPLGRVGQRVDMSVCVFVCLMSPSHAIFFRPLIGPQVT